MLDVTERDPMTWVLHKKSCPGHLVAPWDLDGVVFDFVEMFFFFFFFCEGFSYCIVFPFSQEPVFFCIKRDSLKVIYICAY